MSSARSVSAATSLPKPGALAPDGIGRSSEPVGTSCWWATRSAAVRAGLVGDILRPSLFKPLKLRWTVRPDLGLLRICDPIRSQALAQAAEHLEAGVAVGGLDSRLALEILYRQHGSVADPTVGALSIEAQGGQPLLDLLDFGKGERA